MLTLSIQKVASLKLNVKLGGESKLQTFVMEVSFSLQLRIVDRTETMTRLLVSSANTDLPMLRAELTLSVGCVVLKPAPQDNQQHRADVCKMLVHSDVQRQGLGLALLQHLEKVATSRGRWLLTLDTEENSSGQRLYERCGYVKVGAIPDYALHNDGKGYTAAMFMYKMLEHGT